MYCPAIKMPDYFTRLLRGNMQPTGDLFRSLGVYFQDSPSLHALSYYSFSDIDPQARIDFFIKNLGWHGLRNRLCSIFLYYAEFGHFPTRTSAERVDQLVQLEELYKNSSVNNFSRMFLLGFYLEMIFLDKFHSHDPALVLPTMKMCEEHYAIFARFSQSKVVKIDIVVLVLMHLTHFLGRDFVIKSIAEGVTYENLLANLSVIQNEQLVANLLNYGASIGEEEIFCSRMV